MRVTTITGIVKTVPRSPLPRRERRGTRAQRVAVAAALSLEAARR